MKNLTKTELLDKLVELGIIRERKNFEELTNDALIELIEVHEVREEFEKQQFEDKYIDALKSMTSDQVTAELAEKTHLAIVESRRTKQKMSEIIEKVKSHSAELLRTLK
jgi:hypothetical protein